MKRVISECIISYCFESKSYYRYTNLGCEGAINSISFTYQGKSKSLENNMPTTSYGAASTLEGKPFIVNDFSLSTTKANILYVKDGGSVVEVSINSDLLLVWQPFRNVLSKRCSENMRQFYRRTLMLKCDFNKVAKQFVLFSKALLQCSPVNLQHKRWCRGVFIIISNM